MISKRHGFETVGLKKTSLVVSSIYIIMVLVANSVENFQISQHMTNCHRSWQYVSSPEVGGDFTKIAPQSARSHKVISVAAISDGEDTREDSRVDWKIDSGLGSLEREDFRSSLKDQILCCINESEVYNDI